MRTFFKILIFLFIGVSSAQENPIAEQYVLLRTGMSMSPSNGELITNKEWNINWKSAAQCKVSKKLKDSVKTENKRVWNKISAELKILNPEKEYQNRVRNENERIRKAKELIFQNARTSEIWPEIRRKEAGYLIVSNPNKLSENLYHLRVKRFRRKQNDSAKNKEYLVEYNAENNQIQYLK